jgi:cytochrome c biogenesis protein CcmG/thiol:disulfide interchange protein DsbE
MLYRLTLCAVAAALVLTTSLGCSARPQSAVPSLSAVESYTPEKLNGYQGQVVVLNFWATWCVPCVAEMPALEAVYQRYRERGVTVLGVNVSDTDEKILAFAQNHGVTFPLLRDPQQEAMRAYDVQVIPTTFFIDRQGNVYCWLDRGENQRCVQRGSMTESFLKQQIEALLD